jgi:hypothetical protein
MINYIKKNLKLYKKKSQDTDGVSSTFNVTLPIIDNFTNNNFTNELTLNMILLKKKEFLKRLEK